MQRMWLMVVMMMLRLPNTTDTNTKKMAVKRKTDCRTEHGNGKFMMRLGLMVYKVVMLTLPNVTLGRTIN